MSHSFLIDVSPLWASAPFRNLFAARACTFLTIGVLTFAVNLQIYELTQSTLAVAMLSMALAAPLAISMLAGGLLADRYDKRQLMLWSRLVYLAAMMVLLVNAWQSQPAAWPIFLAAIIAGAATGISMPAFMAAVPALIGRDKLPAAAALGSLVSQSSSILGPALAGLLMAHGGMASCYLVVTLGALLAPFFLAALPPLPAPQAEPAETARQGAQGIIAALRDGFSYIRTSQIIAGLLLIDVAATLFASPFAVLPQFGTQGLGADAQALGLMFSAPAVGALGAALASGWISRLAKAGRALIVAVCAWGLAVAGLGLAPNLTIALACLVAMGFADTVSEILRGAMMQQHTPDALLGRLSSLWLIQAAVTPALGGVAIGALAQVHSPRFAFLIGGATCLIATVGIALLLPTFRTTSSPQRKK